MLLIADSGSTKTDWAIIESEGSGKALQTKTTGFNPFFTDSDFIAAHIAVNNELKAISEQVSEVRFFGAACSSDERKGIVRKALERSFPKAEIHVDHDMLGAALACTQGEPGVACILGTGSNACFFDGKECIDNIPALGFILGDEASGAWFGKRLCAMFVYGEMPDELLLSFSNTYEVDKESIFRGTYHAERPNLYLAGFAPFLSKHADHPYIRMLVREGFDEFIAHHLEPMPESRSYEIHFVGSVAHHFEDILKQALATAGMRMGRVITSPIHELIHLLST